MQHAFTRTIGAVAIAAATLSMPLAAAAAWPEPGKVVTVINGGSPGSGQDLTARLVASALQEMYPGSTFQVLAKPGAGTQLAYQEIADAAPDGYTFGIISLPNFATLYRDKSRQARFTLGSFKPAANFIFDPGAIAVRANSPHKTIGDLLAAAKAAPGKVTVGVGSPRGREHLDVTALEQGAGVKFTSVFHNDSGMALNNLLGGNTDAQQGSVGDFLSQIAAGRVRILSVFSPTPSPFVPDVQTIKAAGYPIYSGVTRGFTFPAGAPDEAVKAVAAGIKKITEEPQYAEKIKAFGFEPRYLGTKELQDYAASEEKRIADLLATLPATK